MNYLYSVCKLSEIMPKAKNVDKSKIVQSKQK